MRLVAPRAHYGFGLGMLFIAAIVYVRLTAFKLDPPPDSPLATQPNALSPNPGWLALRHGRRLNEQQTRALGIQLRQFAAQKFWIIAETGEDAPESEQMRFGRQLQEALISAGWIESQKVLQRMGTAGFRERSMYRYSHGGDRGIVIFTAPDSSPAANGLNTALSGLEFKTSFENDENLKGAILIFVGAE